MARSPLVMVLGFDTKAVDRGAREAISSLTDFSKSTEQVMAEIQNSIQNRVGSAPADLAAGMSRSLQTQISGMRRQAEQALASGKGFNPMDSMSSANSLAAAAGQDKLAASYRAAAAAAQRATAANEAEALGLRQIAAANTVAAASAEKMAADLRAQASVFEAVEREMADAANEAGRDVERGHNRMGVSSQIMMHSVRSATDSFAAGLPPMMIFAEQISRVSEAMAYAAQEAGATEGAMAKFAAFMTSGWGVATIAAIGVLGTLIAHMDLFKDKAVENAKALEEVKAGDDGLSDAQKALGDMFDLTTGKLEHQNEMLRLNARLTAEKLRAEALSDKAESEKTLGTATGWQQGLSLATLAQGLVANALPGSIGNVGDQQSRAQQLQGQISGVASGKVSREDALRWAEKFDFDGLSISRQTFAQALINQVSAQQKTKTADLIDQSLDKGVLDPALRKESTEKKVRTRREAKDPTPANDDAYTALWDKLSSDAGGIGQQNLTGIEAIANAARAKVDAELRKQLDQIASQGRQHDWSEKDITDAQTFAQLNASGKQAEITAKEKRDLASRDLDQQRQALDMQDRLLVLQGDLSTNLKERRDIALKVLENERQAALIGVRKDVNEGRLTGDEGARKMGDINSEYDLRNVQAQRQNAGPIQSYRNQLQSSVGDMNTAMQGVAVDGVKGVADGLAGIISRTQDASQAFRQMATSIIADLARIGVEKMILGVFGLSTGGKVDGRASGGLVGYRNGGIPGFAGGTRLSNGMIKGPGTGTSDSILALVNGNRPIMVSNDEGIVNAQAVKNYWPIIDAMNRGAYPKYATGGLLGSGGTLTYPSIPSARSLQAANVNYTFAPVLTGAVMTEEMYANMNNMAQYHAARAGAAVLAAAPDLSMQRFTQASNSKIP